MSTTSRARPSTPPAPGSGPLPLRGRSSLKLSMGIWRYLSFSAHEKTLWVPYLHKAFPRGTERATVDRKIGDLHELRNRAAHWEPLLAAPLPRQMSDLMWVAGLLSPEPPTSATTARWQGCWPGSRDPRPPRRRMTGHGPVRPVGRAARALGRPGARRCLRTLRIASGGPPRCAEDHHLAGGDQNGGRDARQHAGRPVPAGGSPRGRRHGRGLARRRHSARPPGRGQGHRTARRRAAGGPAAPGGADRRCGERPARRRAPRHWRGPSRRPTGGLPGDGAGRRRAAQPDRRPGPARRRGRGALGAADLRRPAGRTRRRRGAPGHQARQRPAHGRGGGEGVRLRHRPGRRRGWAHADRHRHGDRHALVHVTGAGPRSGGRRPQ